jgi:exoribonuclease R
MKLKLNIHDRDYSTWSFIDEDTFKPMINPPNIVPHTHKLFTKDIILYDISSNIFTTVYSQVRSGQSFAGVLILEGNRSFGRNKKNKLLYKCIPDDKHLPVFLIPYEPDIKFSKIFKNKYVLFQYADWDHVHPRGLLTATIGNVDVLESFYEYQLYCKSLHVSLSSFTNKTRELFTQKDHTGYIEEILQNPHFKIQDRRHIHPFSIDPHNSLDFDDAFSIEQHTTQTKITIYIANVFLWLETFNLWDSFTNRVSTIYLPDKKRPMLPTILSDNLCSLQANKPRFAFAVDITFDENLETISTEFHMVLTQLSHNFEYESADLLKHTPYQYLYDITQKLDKQITDSHDVVTYWMIKMNSVCGSYLAKQSIGIFRQATFTKPAECTKPELSLATKRILTNWNNVSGQYVLYSPNIHHDVMNIANYTHVTSPIRRLIDLLNQLLLLRSLSFVTKFSKHAEHFITKWIDQLEYINLSMRSIRKIQTDCEVLQKCMNTPTILEQYHKCILFDKLEKNDGGFIYMVFIEQLNMLTRLKTYTDYDNYTLHKCQLFLFTDESNLKKKIRVQLVTV